MKEKIEKLSNIKKEFSFEDGVKEAIFRIKELLKNKESAIIAIIGSGINVGKTKVSSKIGELLIKDGLRIKWCGDTRTLSFESEFLKSGEVLILHAESPYIRDVDLKDKAEKFNLSFSKIDLRIFIYRPDTPFYSEQEKKFADILIRNENAIDKK